MCGSVWVGVCARVRMNMYECMNVYGLCVCICVHVYMYVCICMHVYGNVCVFVCKCVCVCVPMHEYFTYPCIWFATVCGLFLIGQ